MALTHDGDLDIHSDITVTRAVTGSIKVRAGGVLVLMGIAEGGVVVCGRGFARISGTTGGLFVAVGGQAVLTGTCRGSATNDGGLLIIEGVVTGALIEHAGTTDISPSAVIANNRSLRGSTPIPRSGM
jgi:hypothetical protein